MDINKLIEAVHELIDEIEGSDYVDMVHSDLRVIMSIRLFEVAVYVAAFVVVLLDVFIWRV